MTDNWQPIATTPDRPMAVLFFWRDMFFWRPDGSEVSAPAGGPDGRDERLSVGYWDGDAWRENGTGHDLFEAGLDERHRPTDWRPISAPPGREGE